jgi:hypothetical protein
VGTFTSLAISAYHIVPIRSRIFLGFVRKKGIGFKEQNSRLGGFEEEGSNWPK